MKFLLQNLTCGSLTINIDDLVFRCCAGDVLLINSNVPHLSFYDECVFNKLQFSAEDHSSLKLYTIKKFVSRTQMSEPAHIFKAVEEYTFEITEIIEQNYQNKITLEEISNIANVSQKHFCRMFKNALDASFTQYLISVRLFNAAKLLLTTDDSIINISEKCVFGSISHFNHKFKEFYNCSPKEYRTISRSRKS